jgi:glycosyltransferase involved in cell wall biosynthesis
VGIVAAILRRLLNQEYVYETNDFTAELYCEKLQISSSSILYRILLLAERISVRHAKSLIAVNFAMKSALIRRHPFISSDRIVAIYSSWRMSDISTWAKTAVAKVDTYRSLYGLRGFKMILLYSGNMEADRRGIMELLDVVRDLVRGGRNIKLLLIGDGELREAIMDYISINGLHRNICFTGWLALPDYMSLLYASDVAIIPLRSTALTNIATPNKLFEFMAFGKVIVASKLDGLSGVIEDRRNGLLVSPYDLRDALRGTIERILEQGIPTQLGRNAKRDFVRRFCGELQNDIFLEAIS